MKTRKQIEGFIILFILCILCIILAEISLTLINLIS